jgi:hypothetical protein
MHQAMAEAFLFAGGNNDEEDVRCYFERYTNEELADEAEGVWEAAQHPDYDRGEFLAAIDMVRTRLNQPVFVDPWPC